MKHFFTTRLLTCLALLLVLLPLGSRAQALTQADFAGVVVPQYMANGTATRLPVLFRATVSNLTPATLYRAYVLGATNATTGGGTADFGGAATTNNSGAGIPLLINTTATGATYTSASTGSLTTAGSYMSFTTDAAGAYTGWFGFLNSGNARYTTGNLIFPAITLAKDATPTVVEKRLALNQSIITLDFATTGTGIQGASSATAGNAVAIYDNAAGTGRPLSATVVENIGVTLGSVVPYYSTAAGTWNAIMPRANASGVQRVVEHSIVSGNVLNCNSDADGIWPSGANTVNPTGGTTPVVLTATDAPLNAGCGAAATATITATPATLTAFTTAVGTPSATQTVTVGGTTLTAGITATAPAGYEVSLSATTGFAASVVVAQTAGTAASTPVYVRLAGTTAGTFAGNIALTSTGATAQAVAVTGTVTAAATPVPTITSFSPASGPVGTTVTVTGTDFTGATGATLNGLAVTSFVVVSATSVTFAVPAAATSGVIVVTTPGGAATSATSFTVVVPAATPTISTLSPARAVVGGAAFVLTVGGTNFTATTQLSFRGQNYTAATVNTAGTSMTVSIPASAIATVGQFTVTATNGGTASGTLDFSVVAAATTVAYEDFEQATRTSYTDAAPVVLRSGTWTFTQALIGDLFNDRVNQIKSARVRGGGSVAMNFDKPNGAGIVTISAALYGSDTGPTFTAEISSDGGATYTAIAGTPATLTNTLTAYPLTVNRTGNVRLRFSTTNATAGQNPRINFDDLTITDFIGSATTASQAMPGLTISPNPATDRITVALPKSGAATVALRDLTGRLVLAPAALAADQQLRLPASLAAGVYLLEVQQGSVTAVRRVQKN